MAVKAKPPDLDSGEPVRLADGTATFHPRAGDVVLCAGCGEPLVLTVAQAAATKRRPPAEDSMGRRPSLARRFFHGEACRVEAKRLPGAAPRPRQRRRTGEPDWRVGGLT